jgi:hypothetical protein
MFLRHPRKFQPHSIGVSGKGSRGGAGVTRVHNETVRAVRSLRRAFGAQFFPHCSHCSHCSHCLIVNLLPRSEPVLRPRFARTGGAGMARFGMAIHFSRFDPSAFRNRACRRMGVPCGCLRTQLWSAGRGASRRKHRTMKRFLGLTLTLTAAASIGTAAAAEQERVLTSVRPRGGYP